MNQQHIAPAISPKKGRCIILEVTVNEFQKVNSRLDFQETCEEIVQTVWLAFSMKWNSEQKVSRQSINGSKRVANLISLVYGNGRPKISACGVKFWGKGMLRQEWFVWDGGTTGLGLVVKLANGDVSVSMP
ncbi:hypothetical protein ACA910_015924 [Epithemia clementina (nom. ined.)]